MRCSLYLRLDLSSYSILANLLAVNGSRNARELRFLTQRHLPAINDDIGVPTKKSIDAAAR